MIRLFGKLNVVTYVTHFLARLSYHGVASWAPSLVLGLCYTRTCYCSSKFTNFGFRYTPYVPFHEVHDDSSR